MGDFLFVVKCLIATVVLVVILQIRVGGRTMESHTVQWIHRSAIAKTLDDVAEGAVKVGHEARVAISHVLGSDEPVETLASEEPAGGWFKIKRSAAYYKQQKEKASKLSHKRSDAERSLSDSERDGAFDDSSSEANSDERE